MSDLEFFFAQFWWQCSAMVFDRPSEVTSNMYSDLDTTQDNNNGNFLSPSSPHFNLTRKHVFAE